MTTLLDLPSKKVFIKNLVDCQRYSPQESEDQVNKKLRVWQIHSLSKPFQATVVWIQGTTVQVEDKSDIVNVDDGTGVARVTGCNKIPFLSHKLKAGQYIMVIGQIVSPGSRPILRAIKVQNLSHVVDIETAWNLEVIDQMMLAD